MAKEALDTTIVMDPPYHGMVAGGTRANLLVDHTDSPENRARNKAGPVVLSR